MAFEGARVYRSDAQAIAEAWTAIDFDTERYDTDNMWEGVSRPDRFYINTAGKYLFVLCVGFTFHATGNRSLLLKLNDTTNIAMVNDKALAAGGNILIVSTIWDCSQDDFVNALATQESGGALNIIASLNICPEFMAQRLDA